MSTHKAGVHHSLIVSLLMGSSLQGQVEPPPIPPDPPASNRGVVGIDIEPTVTPAQFNVFAHLTFETAALGREDLDLSTELAFLINGATQMTVPRTLIMLGGAGAGCEAGPCDETECGLVSFAVAAAPIFCRESAFCLLSPVSCPCRCGDTIVVAGPREVELTPGDEITVILRPAPGAVDEDFQDDDTFTRIYDIPAPNGDFNGDNSLTLVDYREMVRCVTGPDNIRLPSACRFADLHPDDAVDLLDIWKLQLGFTALIEPCSVSSLKFHWPMPGVDARHWVINNYVDLNTSNNLLQDFMGNTGSNAKTYDNHRGIDVDVSSFREMDNNFPINAAAAGTVEFVRESEFDRNTSCTGTWNVVTVRHGNGFLTYYGHLKKNSVVVNVGDWVVPGQKLGVVGSSGCSTQAHLHLEVHDCDDKVVDPFLNNMFFDPPVYDTPLDFMDVMLRDGAVSSIAQLKDPPPNVSVIAPGDTLGVGLSMAGGENGDQFTVTFRRPNNTVFTTANFPLNQVFRHHFWWSNPVIQEANTPTGFWKVEIRTNGALRKTYNVGVSTFSPNFFQIVQFGIPQSQYQAVFQNINAAGYRPVWVDGYDVFGDVYFNVIFDKSSAGPWEARHDLNGQEYNDFVNLYDDLDYRLIHVDSYRDGNTIRYAAIMVKDGGPTWTAYHGKTVSQHQSSFNALTGFGYRAVNISLVEIGSTLYVTALYDKKNVGGWVAQADLTSGQYQTAFNNWTGQGLNLAYLDVYLDGGVPMFSAIWDSTQYNNWVARHDRDAGTFQNDFNTWSNAGYLMNIITGYRNGFEHNFAGYWVKD